MWVDDDFIDVVVRQQVVQRSFIPNAVYKNGQCLENLCVWFPSVEEKRKKREADEHANVNMQKKGKTRRKAGKKGLKKRGMKVDENQ